MTPPVCSRKLMRSDVDDYHRITGDAETMRYITGQCYSPEETKKEVERLVDSFGNHSVFGIRKFTDAGSGAFIGVGGLMPLETEEQEAELGFRIVREKWNRGFGQTIAQILVNLASRNALTRLWATVDERNLASIHILENLGFQQVSIEVNGSGRKDLRFSMNLNAC